MPLAILGWGRSLMLRALWEQPGPDRPATPGQTIAQGCGAFLQGRLVAELPSGLGSIPAVVAQPGAKLLCARRLGGQSPGRWPCRSPGASKRVCEGNGGACSLGV